MAEDKDLRQQAEENLEEFGGETLEEKAVLAMEIMSLFAINEHQEDALRVLGKQRVRRILDDTEDAKRPENDTEVFEYVNAILDRLDE